MTLEYGDYGFIALQFTCNLVYL